MWLEIKDMLLSNFLKLQNVIIPKNPTLNETLNMQDVRRFNQAFHSLTDKKSKTAFVKICGQSVFKKTNTPEKYQNERG